MSALTKLDAQSNTLGYREYPVPVLYRSTAQQPSIYCLLITTLAIAILFAPTVAAGPCEDMQLECTRGCRGGDPRDASYCLVGCGLAYLVCRWFGG